MLGATHAELRHLARLAWGWQGKAIPCRPANCSGFSGHGCGHWWKADRRRAVQFNDQTSDRIPHDFEPGVQLVAVGREVLAWADGDSEVMPPVNEIARWAKVARGRVPGYLRTLARLLPRHFQAWVVRRGKALNVHFAHAWDWPAEA
jgi:hypothetical protein